MCSISLLYIINTIILEVNKFIKGFHRLTKKDSFYIEPLPSNILQELNTNVPVIESNFSSQSKANDLLEGEIQHEYLYTPSLEYLEYIKSLGIKYEKFSNFVKKNIKLDHTLSFGSTWINFQKKHEYNPPHIHSGVYSYVIWYKIPYLLEDEHSKYSFKSLNSNNCKHGLFEFWYINKHKKIASHPIPVDSKANGYVCIFNANLSHTVYPFYSSNQYRITISGNIIASTIPTNNGNKNR